MGQTEYMRVKLPLVEREGIREEIDRKISEVQFAKENKKAVINITGKGGHGKTFFNEDFVEKHKDKLIVAYDFQSSPDVGIDDILYSWAYIINQQNTKFQFELFAYVYDEYQNRVHSNKKAQFRTGLFNEGFLPLVRKAAKKILVDSFKDKPFIEEVVDGAEKVLNPLFDKIMQKFNTNQGIITRVNSCRNENEMRQWLTRAFVIDLNEALADEVEPILFLLDTYEIYTEDVIRVNRYTEEWLQLLIASLENAVWIISGRRELEWDSKFNIKPMEVKAITNKESFLAIFGSEGIDIQEEEHQKWIENVSNGVPILISNCINEYLAMRRDGILDLSKITGDMSNVVARIERDLSDGEKDLLHILSLFEFWPNKDVLESVLSDNLANMLLFTKFDSLLRKNLIRKNGMEKELARCLRKTLPKSLKLYFFKHLVNFSNQKYQNYIDDWAFRLFCELSEEESEEVVKYKAELLEQLKEDVYNNPMAFEKKYSMLQNYENELSMNVKTDLLMLRRVYENFYKIVLFNEIEDEESNYLACLLAKKNYQGLFIFGEAYINRHRFNWANEVLLLLYGEKNSAKAQLYAACIGMLLYNEQCQWAKCESFYGTFREKINGTRDDLDCYYKIRLEYWRCLHGLGIKEAAVELVSLYEELLEAEPNNPIMKDVKMRICEAEHIQIEKRLEIAREEYEKGCELIGDKENYLMVEQIRTLAKLLKENGEYIEAIEHYEGLRTYYLQGNSASKKYSMKDMLSLASCYKKIYMEEKAYNIFTMLKEAYLNVFDLETLDGLEFVQKYIHEYYELLIARDGKNCDLEIEFCHKALNQAKNAGERCIKKQEGIYERGKLIEIYELLVSIKKHLGYGEESEPVKNAIRRMVELDAEIKHRKYGTM